MKTYEQIKEYIQNILSEKRFYHSECVANRCIELAKIYEVDEEKAKLVGIAHDVAKEMPAEEQIKYAKENGIKLDEIELKNTKLLHAIIGAKICEKEFGFTKDMVEAVRNHTTGTPYMDMLSKVLFISDATGIDRTYDEAKHLYEIATKDIDQAIFECLSSTIKEIVERGLPLHIDTVRTRNEYLLK